MWKNFYKSVFVAVLFCFCLFPFRNATGTKKENVASSYISVMAILKTFFFLHACFTLIFKDYILVNIFVDVKSMSVLSVVEFKGF